MSQGAYFVGVVEGEGHLGGRRFVPSELPIGAILDVFGMGERLSSRDRIVKCGGGAWVKVDGEIVDDAQLCEAVKGARVTVRVREPVDNVTVKGFLGVSWSGEDVYYCIDSLMGGTVVDLGLDEGLLFKVFDGEVGDDKRVSWLFFGIDGGCSALTGEDAMRIIKESGVTPIVSPVGKFDGAFRPFTVPARYVSPWWQG